jgi:hypothetical protein
MMAIFLLGGLAAPALAATVGPEQIHLALTENHGEMRAVWTTCAPSCFACFFGRHFSAILMFCSSATLLAMC